MAASLLCSLDGSACSLLSELDDAAINWGIGLNTAHNRHNQQPPRFNGSSPAPPLNPHGPVSAPDTQSKHLSAY